MNADKMVLHSSIMVQFRKKIFGLDLQIVKVHAYGFRNDSFILFHCYLNNR